MIGMTNMTEARLAREAEISFAPLSMSTDYDCWKDEHVRHPVRVAAAGWRWPCELRIGAQTYVCMPGVRCMLHDS